MTTPAGTIAFSDVNVELRLSSTAQINLNDSEVRLLAGRPSGQISMNDLLSKTYGITTTLRYAFFPGSKGIAAREELTSIYTIYEPTGSTTQRILGLNTNVCALYQTLNESAATQSQLTIEVSGNLSGSYSAAVNGSTISNSKSGSFNGSVTTFTWDTSAGDTLPTAYNPFSGASFGGIGTNSQSGAATAYVQLV